MMNRILILIVGLCCLVGAVRAQNPNVELDTVSVEVVQLTESIYVLFGFGGNIGLLVGEDGPIIIDDQFEQIGDSLRAAVASVSEKPIQFVVNTHWHYDHADGNKALGPAGIIIVAHENSRERLKARQVLSVSEYVQEAYPSEALPDITFDESIRLHWNGDEIEIFHVPNAHTDGDAIVWFKNANVFHTGDVFVTYGFPFIDHENGGDLDGIVAAAEKIALLADDETQFIPGHGKPAGKSDLLKWIDMLKTLRGRVAKLVESGKSMEEIVGLKPAEGLEGVGGSPDVAVRWTYMAISKNADGDHSHD